MTAHEDVDKKIEDVNAAEQDALTQDAELATLEARVANGDLSVTAAQIEEQSSIARHAHRVAEGVRNLFTQSEARRRDRALRELASDIEEGQGKGAAALLDAWDTFESAARAFQTLADAYDANVREWEQRARDLNVGLSTEHGLSEQGGIRFHGDHLEIASAPDRFQALFIVSGGGYYAPLPLRAAGDDMVVAARAALKRLGGDDE